MKTVETIKKYIRFNEEHLKLLIEDIPEDIMSKCPHKGITNHPAWTIGHLFDASEMCCDMMGSPSIMPKKWVDTFRRTGPGDPKIPPTEKTLYPSKDTLMEKYIYSHQRQLELIDKCSTDFFDEKVDWAFGELFPTKLEILHFMNTWHETNHISQLSVWRRAMDMPTRLKDLKTILL